MTNSNNNKQNNRDYNRGFWAELWIAVKNIYIAGATIIAIVITSIYHFTQSNDDAFIYLEIFIGAIFLIAFCIALYRWWENMAFNNKILLENLLKEEQESKEFLQQDYNKQITNLKQQHAEEVAKYEDKLKQLEKIDRYCNISNHFANEYPKVVKIEKQNGTAGVRSNLWYLFVNTRDFKTCKQKIINCIQGLNSEEVRLHNVEIWSLLGASELLVKFRSSFNMAYNFEETLFETLKRPIPIIDITLKEEFVGDSSSVLESTHRNKKGLQLINCTFERVLERKQNTSFLPGKLLYMQNINHNMRSIKVFIKFHFDKNNHYNDHIIREVLRGFDETVELFTICEHSKSGELKFIIIEAHYPCGRFNDLFKLSQDLENSLTAEMVKETYIGYAGGPMAQLNRVHA